MGLGLVLVVRTLETWVFNPSCHPSLRQTWPPFCPNSFTTIQKKEEQIVSCVYIIPVKLTSGFQFQSSFGHAILEFLHCMGPREYFDGIL